MKYTKQVERYFFGSGIYIHCIIHWAAYTMCGTNDLMKCENETEWHHRMAGTQESASERKSRFWWDWTKKIRLSLR